MSQFKIEKGVPLPPSGRTANGGRKSPFPFMEMEVGDRFIVPCAPEERWRTMRRLSASASVKSTRHVKAGRKFAMRMLPEGVGCWRIA